MPAAISLLLLLGIWFSPAVAEQIDLSTLPGRDQIQLTIYNAEDLTLVRETRQISLSRGINPLQFSWSNTLIDPTSVELSFPANMGGLRLVETRYPHQRPESLNWLVESPKAQLVEVEISYFTSGLSWSAEYQLVERLSGESLRLESHIRVENHSGESYEDAEVRLVVGEIKLVERIAELAQRRVTRLSEIPRHEMDRMRLQAAREVMGAPMPMMAKAGRMADFEAPAEVAKESLGDYFIYTIGGRASLNSGWSSRLLNFSAEQVAFERVYRYRPEQYGRQLVQLYLIANNSQQGLGVSPLPAGELYLYREQADGGVRLAATSRIDYVPIGDKLELLLGQDSQVTLDSRILRSWYEDIWLEYKAGRTYKRLDDDSVHFEHDAPVAGWDLLSLNEQRLVNHSPHPVVVEVRLSAQGDAQLTADQTLERHDFASVDYRLELAAGATQAVRYLLRLAQGHSSQQSGLEVVSGQLPSWP